MRPLPPFQGIASRDGGFGGGGSSVIDGLGSKDGIGDNSDGTLTCLTNMAWPCVEQMPGRIVASTNEALGTAMNEPQSAATTDVHHQGALH
jgi:hypothetical protein